MPRLLDLFCGAGGAAAGYVKAGFEVYGVDIEPQPHYLDSGATAFIRRDALGYMAAGGWRDYDAIHASPPCQAYSSATGNANRVNHLDLYDPTRALLMESGLPYVIENVIGAPYGHGIVLCGSMFDLTVDGEWIQRHRNFETSWLMFQPPCDHPEQRPIKISGGGGFTSEVRDYRHSRMGTWELCQRLMGIDWMSRKEFKQAIPPAYTEWLGRHLLEVI